MIKHSLQTLFAASLMLACASQDSDVSASQNFIGVHRETLVLGDIDNVESIKVLPGTRDVLSLSSKSRQLTRLSTEPELKVTQSRVLDELPDEGETTNFAVAHSGAWAAVIRTLIEVDGEGAVSDCGGRLLIISLEPEEDFGEVLAQVDVGPMPDSVAISNDDGVIVVGNERDVVWGKCAEVSGLAAASLSVITFDPNSDRLVEKSRLQLSGEREPEGIAITSDGTVMVTLQDTHEVLTTTLDVLSSGAIESDLTFSALAPNDIGQDAWPDGIASFESGGQNYFAIAGEGNDLVYVLDKTGQTRKTLFVSAASMPSDFPVDGSWGPLYRPDSMASLNWLGQTYVATSLKASGALGIWEVDDFDQPWKFSALKVGRTDELGASEESEVQTEGVAASSDYGFIVTANERESSISLVVAE